MLGIRLGATSIEVLLRGSQNVMVGLINNMICTTSFQSVVKQHQIDEELQGLLEIFGS